MGSFFKYNTYEPRLWNTTQVHAKRVSVQAKVEDK